MDGQNSRSICHHCVASRSKNNSNCISFQRAAYDSLTFCSRFLMLHLAAIHEITRQPALFQNIGPRHVLK